MTTLISLLQGYVFPGVAGNAAYDVAKTFWRKAFGKSIEDLYIDAFNEAAREQAPRLQKHGTPVLFNKAQLRRGLRQDLHVDLSKTPLARATSIAFANQLSEIFEQNQILTIGGHVLSSHDYRQLATNLLHLTFHKFRTAVTENQALFNEVLLTQSQANHQQLLDIQNLLIDNSDLVIRQLQTLVGQYGALGVAADQLALLPEKVGEIVLKGIKPIFIDYAGRIQNFLDEYLGTPTRFVPFGGRKRELAALDQWLTDPRARPYALLLSVAGRGKSALLVRWAKSILERRGAHVVFIPISIRFDTSLARVTFAALAARLGEIFSDPIKHVDFTTEQWHEVCMSYLSRTPPDGQPLLVILDGIDEAQDWIATPSLFPLSPPKAVKVLVSARYLANDPDGEAWLWRLGWNESSLAEILDCPPLTEEGVGEILTSMQQPPTAVDSTTNILHEIYRLSEGDPLLVRLYLEDLHGIIDAPARLTPSSLPGTPAGLDGYFRRWWEDQIKLWGPNSPLREESVRATLNLLSCAFGPLQTADLLELLADQGIDSWLLETTIKHLERIVVGDGRRHGFVLSHSRLNSYFFERLTPTERTDIENRFVYWGKGKLQASPGAQLRPEAIPRYLVQYLGAHLERADSPQQDMDLLLTRSWHQAWFSYEGAYGGFLNDVARVWRRAEQRDLREADPDAPARNVGTQIRCALYEASINSISEKIPAELIAALVENGQWTARQALSYACRIPLSSKRARAEALQQLTPYLPADLMGYALGAAREIDEPDDLVFTLAIIATHLPQAMRLQVLQEAWDAIGPGFPRYLPLATHYMSQVIRCVPSRHRRAYVAQLQSTVLSIADSDERAMGFSNLLVHLAGSRRTRLLSRALHTIGTVRKSDTKCWSLINLLPGLSKGERVTVLNALFRLVRAHRHNYELARILSNSAPFMPPSFISQALRILKGDRRNWGQDEARAAFAARLAKLGQRDAAISLMNEIVYLSDYLEAIIGVYTSMSTRERHDAYRFVSDLLPLKLESYEDASDLDEKLVGFAHLLARSGSRRKALKVIGHLESWHAKAEALEKVIPFLEGTFLRDAQEIIFAALASNPSTPDSEVRDLDRIWIAPLVKLAGRLSQGEANDILTTALTVARRIQDEPSHALVFVTLAPSLDEPRLAEALNFIAHKVPRRMFIENVRSSYLIKLCKYLTPRLLETAIEMTQGFPDLYERACTMIGLSPYLPATKAELALQEAIRLANTIANDRDRLRALLQAADGLPKDELDRVMTRMDRLLDEKVTDEGVRAWQRFEYASHMEPSLALERLTKFLQSQGRNAHIMDAGFARPLRSFFERTPKESLPMVLEQLHAIPDEENRLEALGAIIPRLMELGALAEALKMIRSVPDRSFQAYALAYIAMHQGEPEKSSLEAEALVAARTNDNDRRRPLALARLAQCLPTPELKQLVLTAQGMRLREGGASILRSVAPHLVTLPSSELTELWTNLLHNLASLLRPDLLLGLSAVYPLILRLGGQNAINEAFQAVHDVGEWWP